MALDAGGVDQDLGDAIKEESIRPIDVSAG